MNAKEGLRRLGLLLAVLGALAGCVGSLIYLADVLGDRDHAKRFQELARTYWRVVQQTPITLGEKSSIASQLPVPKLGPTPPKGFENYQAIPYSQIQTPPGYQEYQGKPPQQQDAARKEALRRNGIDEWYFENEGKLSYIKATDGTTVYAATEPVWSYLLLPVFPVLGFIIPWGAVRLVTWVGSGFFQSSQMP